MQIVGVKFKTGGKVYNFSTEEEFQKGDKVKVETERGIQLGEVAEIETLTVDKNLKEIKGKATPEDYQRYLKNLKDAEKALQDTKKLIKIVYFLFIPSIFTIAVTRLYSKKKTINNIKLEEQLPTASPIADATSTSSNGTSKALATASST